MGKTSERCPRCGSPVPVCRSVTVPAQNQEAIQGALLDKIRYQILKCASCGLEGQRSTYVARAAWPEYEDKNTLMQDCVRLH